MDEGDSLVWSPDSRKVAYIDQYDNLDIINSDGSDKTRLVPEVEAAPRWAPDGQKIIYTKRYGSYPQDVEDYIIGIDGKNETVLEGHTAQWSPIGQKVAYIQRGKYHGDPNFLKVADVTEAVKVGTVTNIAKIQEIGPSFSEDYSWSPDGERILYRIWGAGYNLGYYIANIRTGETYYFGFQRGMTQPVWSPDADKVLYTDEGYIYIINADGTGKTTLTEGSNPQWSPDGKKIAYQFTEKFGKEVLGEYIYVINADGTGQTKLAEGSNPIWSPTSK